MGALVNTRTWRKPPPLESAIENKFLALAKAAGWRTRKLNGVGARSWPDRLVLLHNGQFALIEFKRPQLGVLSAGQEDLFEELKLLDHHVLVTTDAQKAYDYCKRIEANT